jgi:hypothetical protein
MEQILIVFRIDATSFYLLKMLYVGLICKKDAIRDNYKKDIIMEGA